MTCVNLIRERKYKAMFLCRFTENTLENAFSLALREVPVWSATVPRPPGFCHRRRHKCVIVTISCPMHHCCRDDKPLGLGVKCLASAWCRLRTCHWRACHLRACHLRACRSRVSAAAVSSVSGSEGSAIASWAGGDWSSTAASCSPSAGQRQGQGKTLVGGSGRDERLFILF